MGIGILSSESIGAVTHGLWAVAAVSASGGITEILNVVQSSAVITNFSRHFSSSVAALSPVGYSGQTTGSDRLWPAAGATAYELPHIV
jgi:hypothetical protein